WRRRRPRPSVHRLRNRKKLIDRKVLQGKPRSAQGKLPRNDALRRAGLKVESCTMDSHTISALNRLEVAGGGVGLMMRGADCFGRRVGAAPRCGDGAAIRLIAFSADLAKRLRGEPDQIRDCLCQGGCGPVMSVQ